VPTFGPYPSIVRDWHDGDTCGLDIDLGFDHTIVTVGIDGTRRLTCRVYGINAPELSNPDGSGKAALTYALSICPAGTRVLLVSHGWDKYAGRFDGSLTLPDGSDFGERMVGAGHAVVMA